LILGSRQHRDKATTLWTIRRETNFASIHSHQKGRPHKNNNAKPNTQIKQFHRTDFAKTALNKILKREFSSFAE
jgi:hypothetical protein